MTASRDEKRARTQRTARLCIVAPRSLAAVLELPSEQVLVGREPSEGGLQLADATVSRQHLQISGGAGDTFSVHDIGSRNGSWLGGEPLGTLPKVLVHGDVLRVGEVVAVFETGAVPPEHADATSVERVLGRSLAAVELRSALGRAARGGGSVLVEGESGTGKESVSAALHELSDRTGPYVVANCAALSSSLADSQLFGHERGAFTGAVQAHEGYFRAAESGSLFLDEIGELPLDLQPKLLRAVEQGEVVPLGGTRVHRVDVRIIAATNRTLLEEVVAGRFRRDLYARLSLHRVVLPPLRERRPDFLIWHDALHQRWCERQGGDVTDVVRFSPEALERLLLQPWPENLRGLDRFVHEIGSLLAQRGGGKVSLRDIAPWDQAIEPSKEARSSAELPKARRRKPSRDELLDVLEREDWNVRAVARHYDRDRRQIYRWLEMYELSRPE